MSRTSSFQRIIALIVIGVGLVSLGVAAMTLLVIRQSTAAQTVIAAPATVNYPAPSLTLNDLDGSTRSLSDFQGQVVLFNMWATWCPPCRSEMPTLQGFYQKYSGKGFLVIGLNDGDPEADVRTFAHQYGLTFPIWLDPTYLSESSFHTMNLPSSFVIDRQGQVRLQWVGETNMAMLEKYVVPIIEE